MFTPLVYTISFFPCLFTLDIMVRHQFRHHHILFTKGQIRIGINDRGADTLGCLVFSPFWNLKKLEVSLGGISGTMKESKLFLIYDVILRLQPLVEVSVWVLFSELAISWQPIELELRSRCQKMQNGWFPITTQYTLTVYLL